MTREERDAANAARDATYQPAPVVTNNATLLNPIVPLTTTAPYKGSPAPVEAPLANPIVPLVTNAPYKGSPAPVEGPNLASGASPYKGTGISSAAETVLNPISTGMTREQRDAANAARDATYVQVAPADIVPSNAPDGSNDSIKSFISNYQQFFQDFDASGLAPASMDYLKGLLSGTTTASRALQAQEAAAMSQGIRNLFQNIGSTAARSGITGGELQRLYSQGVHEVSRMLGDFSLQNIIRMGENQREGLAGVMKMMGLSTDAITAATNASATLQTVQDNWTKWVYDVAATDGAAAVIANKLRLGQPVTAEDIKYITDAHNKNWTAASAYNELAKWKELGVQTRQVLSTNPDGTPLLNSSGQQIWTVEPVFDLDPVTGIITPRPITADVNNPDNLPQQPDPNNPNPQIGDLRTWKGNSQKWDGTKWVSAPYDRYMDWNNPTFQLSNYPALKAGIGNLNLQDDGEMLGTLAMRGSTEALNDLVDLYMKDSSTLEADYALLPQRIKDEITKKATISAIDATGKTLSGYDLLALVAKIPVGTIINMKTALHPEGELFKIEEIKTHVINGQTVVDGHPVVRQISTGNVYSTSSTNNRGGVLGFDIGGTNIQFNNREAGSNDNIANVSAWVTKLADAVLP